MSDPQDQSVSPSTDVPPTTGQPLQTQHPGAEAGAEKFGDTMSPSPTEVGASSETVARVVADYEILGELGRGGMGVVYKARQLRLNRLVALKMILHAQHATERERQRFQHEAEVLAQLQHDNVVKIYEVGEHDSRPFFSLEFVEGGNLDQKLRGTPQPPLQAARLLELLARGVHAAHEAGIVHRDLKPANILLAGDRNLPLASCVPKITDFGLAKHLQDEVMHTATGAILGTPSYMAPEQAGGKSREIGPATDVWALGAILSECLTGRPPFKDVTTEGTLLQVLCDEPVPPRRLNPQVPRDLETICLKCLQKEKARRYASARDLADDLRRFLDGKPIHARPIGSLERGARWVRRNPVVASLLALVVLVTLAGAGGVIWKYREAEKENREKTAALAKEQSARAALEEQLYDNYIAVAERELAQDHDVGLASDLLARCPEHLRGWEWDYLMRLRDGQRPPLVGHQGGLWTAEFSPDGRRLVTASIDGTAKVWDVLSQDTGRLLLTFRGHALLKLSVPGVPRVPVMCASFSPDGRHIATGSFSPQLKLKESRGVVKIWDSHTGQELLTFKEQVGVILSLAYSRDGRRIASSSINNDNTFVVWDSGTGAVIKVVSGHTSHVHKLRYSPDGRLLASASTDGTVKLWDAASLKQVLSIKAHPAPIVDVSFSPRGERFASAGEDGTARVWETATGARILTLRGHTGSTLGVSYSPDGKRIATSGFDKTVRLWDAATGKEKMTLRGHSDTVWGVTFSPNGRQLASASFDTKARIWDATPRAEKTGPGLFTIDSDKDQHIGGIAFSADGRYLAFSSWDHTVRLRDARTGAALHTLKGHQGPVWGVAFSPDSKRLASSSWDHKVKIWDTASGRELLTFSGHTAPVQGVSFSPDGKRLASASWDATVKIWHAETGKVLATCEGGLFPTVAVAFSPDGKRVASGRSDRNVMIWDAATGKALLTLKGHKGTVPCVAFSPDGKRLASASWDHTVRVWDVSPGPKPLFYDRALLTFTKHTDRANGVAFSPDGSRIASAGEDKMVRVWDPATGKEVGPPLRHRGSVWTVAYDPTGKRLVGGCWSPSGAVRTWSLHEASNAAP